MTTLSESIEGRLPAGADSGTAGGPPRVLRRRIGVAQTLANGLTLAWRNIMQLKHSPEKLMDVTLMPIIFLLLFLYVFGGVVSGSTHAYLEVLLPGLVGQMAMFATMGLGTALCEDIHKGVFDRFRSLPIARSAPLIGAVLGDTVRFCVVMAVLTGFGSALGFRFHTGLPSILAAYALAYAFYLAVCWISVLIGLVAPSPETVQGISFIWVMPLVFGSSVLLPNTKHDAGVAAGVGQREPGVPAGRLGPGADDRRPPGRQRARHPGLGGRDRDRGVPPGHAHVPAPRLAPSRPMIARHPHRPPWRPARKLPATRRTVLGRGTWSLVWTGGWGRKALGSSRR